MPGLYDQNAFILGRWTHPTGGKKGMQETPSWLFM